MPDERLDREFDVSIDLTMSSVIYTHTKRFPIELINFFQDFIEHHDKLGHMRAASSGQQVSVHLSLHPPHQEASVSLAVYQSEYDVLTMVDQIVSN